VGLSRARLQPFVYVGILVRLVNETWAYGTKLAKTETRENTRPRPRPRPKKLLWDRDQKLV